jgi:hypothetical protein
VQLALFGAMRPDSARALFGRWIGTGDLARAVVTLPWWTSQRDSDAVRRVIARSESVLRQPGSSPGVRAVAQYGVDVGRARLSLIAGDSSRALAQFLTLPDTLCRLWCYFDRFETVRLLTAAGNAREAAIALDRRPPSEGLTVTEVIWWLERARVAAKVGDRELERRGYEFVSRVWAKAGPELQSEVNEARAGLARLTTVAMRRRSTLATTSD